MIGLGSDKNSFKFPQCFISPTTCRGEANNGNHQRPRFYSHFSPDDDADNRKLHLAPSSTVTVLFFTENTMFCTGIKDLVRKSMFELFCAGTKSKVDIFCLHQNKTKSQHEIACIWLLLEAISFVRCEWWIYSQFARLGLLEGRKKNMNNSKRKLQCKPNSLDVIINSAQAPGKITTFYMMAQFFSASAPGLE